MKQQLRGDLVNELISKREQDIEDFVKYVMSRNTQARIEQYLDNLRKKSELKNSA